MSRRKSFEERARAEVERIKAKEAEEEERRQARLTELAEQARQRREAEAAEGRRREAEREAKLRRVQEERGQAEEMRTKDLARRRWKANGGTEAAFEGAWPSMWEEMLRRHTMDAERQARESQRASGVSRI
jgi:hypothetical protein